MENDRTVRRLTALVASASTARVLNLLATHRRLTEDPGLAEAPFFANKLLNRSIILKHRVRPHEASQFATPRSNATKILIPIDTADLRAGARTVFVGEKDFDLVVRPVFGEDLARGSDDRRILDLIDGLPSFDPFLLREHLRANGVTPARGYFGISDADAERMFDFVREEIMALVGLSSGGATGLQTQSTRLVEKLLSSAPDSGFEPLKETLRLSDTEYVDGMFSWRGFLYYKWMLADLARPMGETMVQITKVQSRGPKDPEAAAYIPEAKTRIQMAMGQAAANVQTLIATYDTAYAGLTRDAQPGAFRDFLVKAPGMFVSLGEQLGAIQHVVSVWRMRFPPRQPVLISPGELQDMLMDFEDSLMFQAEDEGSHAWVA